MRYKAAADVAQVVRQGTTLSNGREYLDIENQVWVDFAEDVIPMKFPAAEFMATQLTAPTRLLDFAAGHGIFGVKAAACTSSLWTGPPYSPLPLKTPGSSASPINGTPTPAVRHPLSPPRQRARNGLRHRL